jgi:hypothetical protein
MIDAAARFRSFINLRTQFERNAAHDVVLVNDPAAGSTGVQVMKKFVIGLTAALALGVMAAPSVTNAANEHVGGATGGHASASRGNGGGNVARSSGGNRGFASVQNRSARVNTSASARVSSTRGNNGNRWAGNGRHRHGSGIYAGYDTCWQHRLTPFGYRYVNVCTDYNDIF